MGWTRLADGSVGLVLCVLFAGGGCGSSDASTPRAGSAGTGGTASGSAGVTAAGSAGAAAGSGGDAVSSAGDASGGSAVANGGVSAVAGAGAGPETVNLYVDELRRREGCLPRPLPVVETAEAGFEGGQARCQIALATAPAGDAPCACNSADHLTLASAGLAEVVVSRAKQNGDCGGAAGVDCQTLCVCELQQCSGAALTQCQNDTTPIAELPAGFCYVDATVVPPLGNAALVASCPQDSRRELRILGPVPEPAPLMFVACASTPLDSP